MNRMLTLADKQHQQSMKQYHARIGVARHLYDKATAGTSMKYNLLLLDDAMALCGSPHYAVSNRRYSKEALAFLKAFTR